MKHLCLPLQIPYAFEDDLFHHERHVLMCIFHPGTKPALDDADAAGFSGRLNCYLPWNRWQSYNQKYHLYHAVPQNEDSRSDG